MRKIDQKIGEIGEWLGAGTLNFFGRQFAGKDTQAARLGNYWGVGVISGGDILRSTELPEDVRRAIEQGELGPTEHYKQVVLPYLERAPEGKPLLLSAVGRMLGEEGPVVETVESAGHPLKGVPVLEITEEEAFHRLAHTPSRGRADDTPEGLQKRLDEFNGSTAHVLDRYDDMGMLIRVNAMGPQDVAFCALVDRLHERAVSE